MDKLVNVSALRMEIIQTGDKEELKRFRKLEAGIASLAADIFRLACVRNASIDDAITSLYISGLYHGAMSESERKAS